MIGSPVHAIIAGGLGIVYTLGLDRPREDDKVKITTSVTYDYESDCFNYAQYTTYYKRNSSGRWTRFYRNNYDESFELGSSAYRGFHEKYGSKL